MCVVRDRPQARCVTLLATQAPMWTVGASGPREILAQTPQQVPTNFTSRVLHALHCVTDIKLGILMAHQRHDGLLSCKSAWTRGSPEGEQVRNIVAVQVGHDERDTRSISDRSAVLHLQAWWRRTTVSPAFDEPKFVSAVRCM